VQVQDSQLGTAISAHWGHLGACLLLEPSVIAAMGDFKLRCELRGHLEDVGPAGSLLCPLELPPDLPFAHADWIITSCRSDRCASPLRAQF